MAAAISDFYLTPEQLQEHKIQGIAENGFKLDLAPVPKKLGLIKSEWNPETVLVSFKLETDNELLESKSLNAIKTYGVDMVVANELQTRRTQVTIYHKDTTFKVLEIGENDTKID